MAQGKLTAFGRHLERHGISFTDMARRLGVTDSAVWRWAHGERTPGLGAALDIERVTRGAVRVSDLVPGRKPRRCHPNMVRQPESVVTTDK